jgi:hypothetical protein
MVIIGTETSPEPWQIMFHVLVGLGRVGAVVADAPVRPCRPQGRLRYRYRWRWPPLSPPMTAYWRRL